MEYEINEDEENTEYSIVTISLKEYKYIFYYKPRKDWDNFDCIHCKKNIMPDDKHFYLVREYPQISVANIRKNVNTSIANPKDCTFFICSKCYNTYVQDKPIEGLLGFISLLKVKEYI